MRKKKKETQIVNIIASGFRICHVFEGWPQNYCQSLKSVEKAWRQEGEKNVSYEWVAFLRQWSVEEDISAYGGRSDRRLDKTA